jgi:hypothetical protein
MSVLQEASYLIHRNVQGSEVVEGVNRDGCGGSEGAFDLGRESCSF